MNDMWVIAMEQNKIFFNVMFLFKVNCPHVILEQNSREFVDLLTR